MEGRQEVVALAEGNNRACVARVGIVFVYGYNSLRRWQETRRYSRYHSEWGVRRRWVKGENDLGSESVMIV